jgi:hypothetical protein
MTRSLRPLDLDHLYRAMAWLDEPIRNLVLDDPPFG